MQSKTAGDSPRPPNGRLFAQCAISTAGDVGQHAVEHSLSLVGGGGDGIQKQEQEEKNASSVLDRIISRIVTNR